MRRSWLIKNGDFVTEPGTGFVTAKDVDAALADRVREITTPKGSWSAVALDSAWGVLVMDEDYGNSIFSYQSTPIDMLPIEQLMHEYRRILSQDPTFDVQSVELDQAVAVNGIVRILVKLMEPNGTIREMAVDLDGTMLSLT